MDWKTAIIRASLPLIRNNSIEQEYVDAMIKGVEELGPYIVIAPQIAFAHARPEQGVNATDLSLLISKQDIKFSEKENHHCKLIFVFSAEDDTSHLELLMSLSSFLSEEENVQALINVKTVEEAVKIVQGG